MSKEPDIPRLPRECGVKSVDYLGTLEIFPDCLGNLQIAPCGATISCSKKDAEGTTK